ncbi:MAG TPA: YicC/YloC family endoribonuclease [Stellaceae bacterium]|nr:YicC/YloC family endoribonuclease [Stellaceae bacterium]
MTVASMTGFARAEGQADGSGWVWEIKSVNSKSLDLRFRLPPGYDGIEPPLRAQLAERLKRGAVSVNLTITRNAAAGVLRVNRTALAEIMALAKELGAETGAAPPRLDGLLALRGVLESADETEDPAIIARRQADALKNFSVALDQLVRMRAAEGKRLAAVLAARLDEIAALVKTAERSAAAQPAAAKARLKELLAALVEAVPALSEERLAQEAALIVARGDIREELDRLAAHLDAARSLLMEGVAIGRRLDFLCQEFNREANTLGAKAGDLELTRIGLALKAAIEQLREQVQNIE